ncbi:1,4-beta-xylanase [Nostoc sp. KVJ3]|uniref:endo-1,4-beta-xylanase n=1 Tax=Nostoc sp. KVJ3 TaxID=457945 RepID=UPI0022370608|nr:endo-1,4-beta-xylanase [Nostoc sp. KVJ3]MCW5317192.1 1,4-beta-xylanase [Nostoc sp. KVJ3]
MLARRKFLKNAGYTTLSALLTMGVLEKNNQKEGHSTNAAMASYTSTDVNSPLRQLAASKGKLYGAAIDSVALQKDAGYAALLARECSIATPNGELKWNATEPSPGIFTFKSADIIADFCQKHNIELHGHTLLWNQALPNWVSFPPTRQQLQNHVAGVMGHYKNSPVLKSWDIANEIIAVNSSQTNDTIYGLLPGLTPEYILELFQFAASVDSNKLFYLNDTSVEGASWRSDRWLALIEYLKNHGAKIDGAGLESHLWFSTAYPFDAKGFSSVLKRLNDLQVKPVITELDIIIDFPLPSTIQELDRMVADSYTRYLDLCFAANVDTVITWGISDRYSWIRNFNYMPEKFKADRSRQQFLRPLPYNQNLQPKLARNAIAKAFQQAT